MKIRSIFKALLLLIIAANPLWSLSQVVVNVLLQPPYSPYFSDYLTYENKAVITFSNSGSSNAIYLKGSIVGNNGVEIRTKDGYKPSSPMNINAPGVTLFNGADIVEYFDWANVTTKGIDAAKIIQNNGLPEGSYTICLQAFDFNTDVALSNAAFGCFTFNIVQVEPPVLTFPTCKGKVISTNQIFAFSWFPSPGGPPNTRYVLTLTPMLNADQNPNDALNGATTPAFFEMDLTTPTYIYQIYDPMLVYGKSYAWRVQAYDPMNKVVFRNNGISEACSFVYTEDPMIAAAAAGELQILNPKCKNAVDTVRQSKSGDVVFNWGWSSQFDDTALMKNPAKLKVKGKSISQYTFQLIPAWSAKAGMVLPKTISQVVKAPDQFIKFTASQMTSLGIQKNLPYTLTVTASDSLGVELGKVSSCKFVIVPAAGSNQNKINIKGKLNYQFTDAPERYPANNAAFTVQLTNAKNYTPKVGPKLGGTGSGGGINPAQFFVSGTTNENGEFSVDLPLSASDSGDQYLRFYINNVYYADITENIPISLNYKVKDEKSGKMLNGAKRDSIFLGELLTDVYGYTLKVTLGKGFPEFYYDTLTQKLSSKKVEIDKLTIDGKSQVEAGINVRIYRKTKASFIPYYENGNKVKAGFKPANLPVAEAKTFYEKDAKGVQRTVVVFDHLILNLTDKDEYFIKADLQEKPSKAGSNQGRVSPFGDIKRNTGVKGSGLEEDLEAPEQAFAFFTKPKSGTYGKFAMDYKLISKTPPLSTIAGKLVYVWPSEPGVVRPLGNAKFKISVQYLMDGKELPPAAQPKDLCSFELYGFSGADGEENYEFNTSSAEKGIVVGEGTTDIEGNFKINIINHNPKGLLTNDIYWERFATLPTGKCEKNTPAKENPLDKKHWKENEDWGMDMLGEKGIKEFGNVMDFGNDGLNGKNAMGGEFGFGANKNLFGGGQMGANKAGGAAGFNLKGMKAGGPLPYENEVPQNGEGPYTLERVFTLELLPSWDVFYDKPLGPKTSNISNQFVVQAFQDTSLGTFTAMVDERMPVDQITVKIKGGVEKKLAGAKMVVFRLPDAKVKYMPDGEGTEEHPVKKLLSPSFFGDVAMDKGYYDVDETAAMEWILDAPIKSGFFGNNFELGKHKLTRKGGKYFYQISPDPSQSGAIFEPVIRSIDVTEVTVKLSPSRIAGRVLDESSSKGLKNAKVTIVVTKKNGTKLNPFKITVYDTSGYFEVINGKWIPWVGALSWDDQDKVEITVSYLGFKPKTKSKVMEASGFQFVETYALTPGGKIKGRVVDENGIPVEAYIQREDKTVFENKVTYLTKKVGMAYIPMAIGGDFEIPVQGFTVQKIKIIPKDVGFFDTSLSVTIFMTTNAGDIVVYRRKHRILLNLSLKNADGSVAPLSAAGFPKKQFKATVNNDENLTAINVGSGIYLEFENVSVNQYSILIEDIKGGPYTPLKINISNKESRSAVEYPINLKKGFQISGKVTLNGSPVKNARVYVDHKTTSAMKKYPPAFGEMEARTKADGTYTINGVPGDLGKVTVYATMDTSFTVNGQSKEVAIAGASATANFDLEVVDGIKISELFGFKFSVESIVKNKGVYVATGLVDLGGNTSSFEWLDPNTKVRVRDVEFASESGVGVPKAKSVTLEATPVIKMKYLDKYNVNISSTNSFSWTPSSLVISGENKKGFIKAYAKMVDNSFNFPSTYLSFPKNNVFYLGVKKTADAAPETFIKAISSEGNPNPTFYLCNSGGGANAFKFIGFDASADPKNSYIDNVGKIHLATTVKGKIPNTKQGVVDFFVPDLVLDNNKVYPAAGSAPLKFTLEKWTLEVNDWSIDPTEGGIVSKKCLVKTGVVDVPAEMFNLRSDLFVLKKFKLTDIFLGGDVLKLKEVSSNATLVFDEKCGSDMSPHWRLAIAKNGDAPAAKIQKLPGYLNNEMWLEYIQLISNGDDILTLMNTDVPNTFFFGNGLTKFYPKSLTSSSDYFTVYGDATFDVPRMAPANIGVSFHKEGSEIVGSIDAINMSFEAPGYVKFATDGKTSPIIDKNKGTFTFNGTVVEPGKMNPIPCTLEFGYKLFGTKYPGRIRLKTGYKLSLVADNKSEATGGLHLVIGAAESENGLWVSGSDWNNLRFSGELNDPQSGKMAEKKPIFNFIVYGDIEANSKELKVSSIQTPFGDLDMTFDFEAKELRGVMNIPDGTPMGSWTFGGDMEFKFGTKGFLVCGNGSLNTGTLLVDGFGTFNMGFLLGNYNYDDAIITKVTKYAKDPKGQCWLKDNQSNFNGFYFVGSYDIINEQEGFDIAVASVYFSAVVGVEASLGMNFANNNYKFGVGAHGKVEAGMSAITGTSISGVLQVHVTAAGAYSGGQMSLTGDANLSLSFNVCQSLLVETVCWDESQEAGLDFVLKKGGTKMDFHLGSPGTGAVCP